MPTLGEIIPELFVEKEIQEAYEMELGKFLVAFNKVENDVRILVKSILSDKDQLEIWETLTKGIYKQQVNNLNLLSAGMELHSEIPFTRLNKLNGTRNKFAHGDLRINGFSGKFKVTDQRTNLEEEESLDNLKSATEEARQIENDLNEIWVRHWYVPEPEDFEGPA